MSSTNTNAHSRDPSDLILAIWYTNYCTGLPGPLSLPSSLSLSDLEEQDTYKSKCSLDTGESWSKYVQRKDIVLKNICLFCVFLSIKAESELLLHMKISRSKTLWRCHWTLFLVRAEYPFKRPWALRRRTTVYKHIL